MDSILLCIHLHLIRKRSAQDQIPHSSYLGKLTIHPNPIFAAVQNGQVHEFEIVA